MSEHTSIQWCDSTVNFWEGCTKVSPGCHNCYAEARDRRMIIERVTHWGKGAPRRKSKSAVDQAFSLNLKPWISNVTGTAYTVKEMTPRDGSGIDTLNFHRRRIFSLSLGDWLDDEVEIKWLAGMLDTIRQCDEVTWILCSKRPGNFFDRVGRIADGSLNSSLLNWCRDWLNGKFPSNIIVLASVENQAVADKRIAELIKIPAVCRGLSLEPLLEPVELPIIENIINWIIIGGESGPKARPCHMGWIRSLVEKGNANGIATFVKQLGSNPWNNKVNHFNERFPLRDKKGGDPLEWPEDLRVQQWPATF